MNQFNNSFDARFCALKDDFEFLDNWEDRYRHIIDMGKSLEKLDDAQKNDETKVRGCASQVWLISQYNPDNNVALFKGESDSTLVQGLLSVLIYLYSGLAPAEIIANPPQKVFEELHLNEALTPSRSNGLKSMAARIIDFATANS